MQTTLRKDEYARRRRQLMKTMGKGAIAILPAAPERQRNGDVHYHYRPDSDFHYLTGFNEPEAVAVLIPGREQAEYILFVRDRDPARETQGRVTVVVRDAPDRPAEPAIVNSGDRTVTIRWAAPANNNSPIDAYQVSVNGAPRDFPAGAAGVNQQIDNLANGTAYQFAVRARNAIGWGEWSPLSAAATPYGTPSAPDYVRAQPNGYAPTSVDVTWGAPSNTGGGAVRYDVRIDGGGWQNSGQDRSHRFTGVGAGSHTVQVRAVNLGSENPGNAASDSFGVQNPPPPQPSGSIGKGGSQACDSGGGGCANVRITWTDMDPGRYQVYVTTNGSWSNWKGTYDVAANGRLELLNHLGVRPAGETIAVRFENVSGGTSRTLGAISGSQWNNIPYNTW